jgi:hypothetical protein
MTDAAGTYAFYDEKTGIFATHHKTFNNPKSLKVNTPDGFIALAGRYDPLSQKVDIATGKVVDYQPPAPTADHEWNATTKRWQLNTTAADKATVSATAKREIERLNRDSVAPLRELALGMPGAKEKLQAIQDQVAIFEKQL